MGHRSSPPLRIAWLLALVLGSTACRPRSAAPVPVVAVRAASSVDFGRTWVGFPQRRDLEILNPNQVSVALQLSTAEPFAVLSAPSEVAPGSSVLATLEFHPWDAGVFGATLVLDELELSLLGEGAAPFPCGDATACASVAFDPDAGTCLSTPRADGTDCTASSSCFAAAHCSGGTCVGTLTTCDDHDACTLDVCGQGGCAHLDALPQCPVPQAPCLVATCDADAGCGSAPAPDGTACGAADCSVALVCIGGACVERPVPQGQPCSVAACVDAGVSCGAAWVNGVAVRCGACGAGQVCDATSHTCTTPAAACATSGAACGSTVDACGLPLACPVTCGGTCLGSSCGPKCTPVTCAGQGVECGVAGDGCGGILCCGACTFPFQCNASISGRCDTPRSPTVGGACVPATCVSLGATCGTPGDGCGGTLACGNCSAPEVCGGAGTNRCGVPLEAECGLLGVYGNVVSCGGCPAGTTCGGGGPYRCGVGPCHPLTCAQQGAGPGPIGDGCGGLIDCGTAGTTVPFSWCTRLLYPRCAPKPLACQQLGFTCGVVQSACGPSVDCGTCLAPQTCQANRCQ